MLKWNAALFQLHVAEFGQEGNVLEKETATSQQSTSKKQSPSAGQSKSPEPLQIGGPPPARSARLTPISVPSDKVSLGSPRLYQELQDVKKDLEVVEQITQLISTLHGSYQVSLWAPQSPHLS